MEKKKIGLLGCSKICIPAIIHAVKQVECAEVYGCAAGDYERAGEYAEKYNIRRAFQDYEELLDCSDIDIVYISLANSFHCQWAIEAMRHKKHVLLEKPMCMTYSEALKIEKMRNKSQVCLLEAVMVQHHPWQRAVKDMILQGKYGSLKSISSSICFIPRNNFEGNYRSSPDMGGVCFYDVGSYWLQFVQCLLGLDFKKLTAHSEFNGPNGCDWSFIAGLTYENGVEIQLEASFEKPYRASHTLEFEKGRLIVKDFFRCIYNNVKFYMEEEDYNSGVKNKIVFPPQNFYANQLAFFCDVMDCKRENADFGESIERVRVMENIFKSALQSNTGVSFGGNH